MGWIMCVGCEKLQRDFVAWTFALIAPVQYVLQQVWYSYESIPNAPKNYEMHQNMSLGSNGMDRVRSFRKISMRLRGTHFWTSSARFAPCLVSQPNRPKCTKIVWNAPKHEFRVQWRWNGCVRCEKFRRRFVARTFAPVRPVLHRVS